jgi:TfoX/Sxy family transcriptional regulator of competence genes
MAYDEEVADRIRELLAPQRGLDERRMFGGLAFLLDGNLTVAVSGRREALLVRVGADALPRALASPHAEPAVMAGREMRGWVYVQLDGVTTKRQLSTWLARAVAFVRTLPAKA